MTLPRSMLFVYFLRQLYTIFIFSFIGLTFLFASTNLVTRLPLAGTFDTIAVVFWTMLPLTSFFAIPIASGLAIQIVVGNMVTHQEIVIFYFLQQARHALYKAILLFSVSLGILYIPLVFEWGPRSYAAGKELLLTVAKKELCQLSPRVLHTPFPGFSFFFKEKSFTEFNEPVFDMLLVVFNDKKDHYFFTAQQGFVRNNTLFLKNGSLYNNNRLHNYHARFHEAKVNLNKLIHQEPNNTQPKHLKFFRWAKLINVKNEDTKAYIEFHKRIAQILWQLLIPFLAFFGLFILGRKKNSLITACMIAGSLFLIMYVFLATGQAFINNMVLALSFFYLPPILMMMIFFLMYRKKL